MGMICQSHWSLNTCVYAHNLEVLYMEKELIFSTSVLYYRLTTYKAPKTSCCGCVIMNSGPILSNKWRKNDQSSMSLLPQGSGNSTEDRVEKMEVSGGRVECCKVVYSKISWSVPEGGEKLVHLERFRDPRKFHEDLTKVTEAVTISGERELSMGLTENCAGTPALQLWVTTYTGFLQT